MSALRTHYTNISARFDNDDGTLTVEAIARRSGIMRYRSDSGDRLEFVPPSLIDERDDQGRPIMGMLAGAPNTNEHPAQVIRYQSDSRKAVQVGKVKEEIHIFNDADGERSVKVRFDVSDPQTIDDIRSGRKTGVSMGYLCNVIKEDGEYRGQRYTHRQAMPFSIDHLAIVANPRNPGALITRFDSDDIAVMELEGPVWSAFEIVRVDSCCAACESSDEDEEPKPKKKKVRTDADEVPLMLPIIFRNKMIPVTESHMELLIDDGLVQPIRLDGRDYYLSMDVALNMHNDGVLAIGGACGPGWEGTRGNCKRKKRSIGRTLKTAAGIAAAGVAGGYIAHTISKNPKKVALIGAAALGAGALLRKRGTTSPETDDSRAARARKIELDPPSRIGQNDKAARVKRLAAGTRRRNMSTYISAGAGGKGAGSKSSSIVIPQGTSVKEGRKGRQKQYKEGTGNPGISKYPWRNKR